MNKKYRRTIKERKTENKKSVLAHLKDVPIISVACQKAGISRSTFYRWKKRDKKFAEKADQAVHKGKLLINDMAESKLINAIKEQNMTGIIYWLRNNHPGYADKVELTHTTKSEKLSSKQQKLVKKAIKLTKIIKGGKNDK
jgi:ACT domain-containing protein